MTDYPHIPATLVAGDGWSWSDPSAFASNPPPDWTLKYVLRPVDGGAAITVTATTGSDAFDLTRPAATTASDAPGDYHWVALAFQAATSDRVQLASGRFCILPDPEQAGGDLRTAAERILDAITATIEGRATKDADSYTIEGRSIARTPLTDLLRLQAVYERRVASERSPGATPIQYRRIKI